MHGRKKRQHLEMEIERALFEAERYRLVARTLEHRWNEALSHVDSLQETLARLDPPSMVLAQKEQKDLSRIAWDLPGLWQNKNAPFDLKTRIERPGIRESMVTVEATPLRVLIHWQGGQHSWLDLRKRKVGEHRWRTAESRLDLIKPLARLMSDKQVAAQLGNMGIKTAKDHTWTRARVGNFPGDNQIANDTPAERQARNELTIEETAQKLGVSYSTVQRMIKRHQLSGNQVCPGGPWIIRSEEVETLQSNLNQNPPRQRAPSSPVPEQQVPAF